MIFAGTRRALAGFVNRLFLPVPNVPWKSAFPSTGAAREDARPHPLLDTMTIRGQFTWANRGIRASYHGTTSGRPGGVVGTPNIATLLGHERNFHVERLRQNLPMPWIFTMECRLSHLGPRHYHSSGWSRDAAAGFDLPRAWRMRHQFRWTLDERCAARGRHREGYVARQCQRTLVVNDPAKVTRGDCLRALGRERRLPRARYRPDGG